MEIKRKTEITIATRKRFIVQTPETEEQFFCSQCAERYPLITAEQAAVFFKVSRRAVYQLVENGTAHFVETDAGVLLVCPNLLTKILEGENL